MAGMAVVAYPASLHIACLRFRLCISALSAPLASLGLWLLAALRSCAALPAETRDLLDPLTF